MSDSLSNLFSHIQNGQRSRALTIYLRPTKLITSTLGLLQDHGYIRGYRLIAAGSRDSNIPVVAILLKYKNQKPAIQRLMRVSKPSKRVYVCARPSRPRGGFLGEIEFMRGLGILSTPRGILSDTEAYKLNVGGELLGQVW